MIDCYSSQPHFVCHLIPIWRTLDDCERGQWFGTTAVAAAHGSLGIKAGRPRPERGLPPRPCLVASGPDAQAVGRRPVVLVEHGAGQAYPDIDHSSYSGGQGRDNVVLFLCPNLVVAERNRERYPDAEVAVVGSPRVDALRAAVAGAGTRDPSSALPAVALTFHWNLALVPETRWALPHFEPALPALAERFHMIGHGHPRHAATFRDLWRRLGIEHVADFAEVCQRATILVGDNSSALYEWAALDKPVVTMSAPWYRRDLDAFPRFWAHVPGVHVEEPGDLGEAVALGLSDPSEAAEARHGAVRAVWGDLSGNSAQRAADAVRKTLARLP